MDYAGRRLKAQFAECRFLFVLDFGPELRMFFGKQSLMETSKNYPFMPFGYAQDRLRQAARTDKQLI